MRVIFALIALLGLIQIGFGVASTYSGYNVLVSVRTERSSSPFAGVSDFFIGSLLMIVGIAAARAMTTQR